MTLIFLSTAWLVGIAAAHALSPPLPVMAMLVILPLAGFVLWRDDASVRRIFACGLFLLLGSLRYTLSLPNLSDPGHIAAYRDQGEVTLWGQVATAPDVRDTYTNLRMRVDRVRIEDEEHLVKGTVLVQAPRYPAYAYGDELEVEGQLETPPVYDDFSYRDYLARQGVYAMVAWPGITLISQGGGSPVYRMLLALKARMQATVARILPEPEASLLTGILLGVESGIPKSVQDAFAATGTTHVIAISGFNMSIVAMVLTGTALRSTGRKATAAIVLVGIAAYTVLVGATPSVLRAAMMAALYPLARLVGRQSDALTSCLLAALLVTLLNPVLLWDVGFQLSFAATLGLILYARPFEEPVEHCVSQLSELGSTGRGLQMVREALLTTAAAQTITMPLLLHHFGQLSWVSLLSNSLILPIQPAVMASGGVASVLGLIWMPLGRVAGWVAWLPLSYTTHMVEWTARLSGGSIPMHSFGLPHIVAWYAGVAAVALWRRHGAGARCAWLEKVRAWVPTALPLGALSVATLLIWAAALSLPDGRLHVTFLSVGQGDAILIQTPHGHQILVDGGPSPSTILEKLGRAMPFWDRSLDLVVMTHPDEDHLTGLIPVLERYQVVYAMAPTLRSESNLTKEWGEVLDRRQVTRVTGQRGMRLELEDGVLLEVLHPGAALLGRSDADDNNNSLVQRLVYGRASFLLTGDLEQEGEQALLQTGQPVGSWILKVSHHGADGGTSAPFLDACSPRLAVISVGQDNDFGHPAPELLNRLEASGATILRTDQQGDVELITDGDRVWLRTER